MTIKMRVSRDHASMSYNIYFYQELPNGNRVFAEPCDLVFSENSKGSYINPTIQVNTDAFDFAIENDVKTATDQLLKQKDVDKKDHVESLEEIIYRLIDKNHAGR